MKDCLVILPVKWHVKEHKDDSNYNSVTAFFPCSMQKPPGMKELREGSCNDLCPEGRRNQLSPQQPMK